MGRKSVVVNVNHNEDVEVGYINADFRDGAPPSSPPKIVRKAGSKSFPPQSSPTSIAENTRKAKASSFSIDEALLSEEEVLKSAAKLSSSDYGTTLRSNDDEDDLIDDYIGEIDLKEKGLHEEDEVMYNSNKVTELWIAVEDANWQRAFQIISDKEQHRQMKIWIRNSGSENTTFAWSFWRRLPIHEALRRHAPLWMVSALLTEYPESAYAKTDFGQLPLHIAVECGASPEVVNLVVLANWHAIMVRDKSGRNPIEILNDSNDTSTLVEEDRNSIYNSLLRCYRTLISIENSISIRVKNMQDHHDVEIATLSKEHQIQLSGEQKKQDKLDSIIKDKEKNIETMKRERHALEQHIVEWVEKGDHWTITQKHMEHQIHKLKTECDTHVKHVLALKDLIETKDEIIKQNEKEIKTLKSDLYKITKNIDTKIMSQYNQVESDLRVMLENQRKLKKTLSGHSSSLNELLKERNATIVPGMYEDENEPAKDDCSNISEEVEGVMEAGDAAAAAAAAVFRRK